METIQPVSKDKPPAAEEVQALCQLLAGFRTSLFHGMQSILSNLSHTPLHPGLEGLVSTALTALIGLKKNALPCASAAPVDLTASSAAAPPSLVEESPGVPPPSVPSLKGASPAQASSPSNSGPHAVTPLSWAKVVGNSNLAFTQTCQSDNSNVWTPVQRRNSRAQKQQTAAAGSGVTPSPTSIPSPGNQWSQFPSRREERDRDRQPICEGAPSSTDRPLLTGWADSGFLEVTVCQPALRSRRNGHGGRGFPPVTFPHVN